jgi:hypothetical protein
MMTIDKRFLWRYGFEWVFMEGKLETSPYRAQVYQTLHCGVASRSSILERHPHANAATEKDPEELNL